VAEFQTKELVTMAKGEMPVYKGMVNDGNGNKVGDVSVWRNESKNGLSYLAGVIASKDGTKQRIVLFEAKKKESGNQPRSHP